jgi:hypothetical protein
LREEGGGRRSEGGERGEGRGERGGRREERVALTLRARARGRRAAGRERNNSPFSLRFFDPRVGRDSRAKIMQKNFYIADAPWGKIRKNPNKMRVFGGEKKIA